MRLIEYLFFLPGPIGPVFAQWGGHALWAYLALAAATLLFTAVMAVLNGRHGLKNRVTGRVRLWGLAMQALGVVVLWLRTLNAPIISMRFWTFAQIVGELVLAGYLLWWLRERYPALMTAYEYEERKRTYLPRAAGGEVEPLRRRAASRRR